MAFLFSRAISCPLAEFLNSTISMYPPAGLSIETVSDTVNRLYSTVISCSTTLPHPWFMQDGLKPRRVLSPHWLSIYISNVAPVTFIFISLILSITIFGRIVLFWVLDRYTTSLLPSCFAAIMGEFTSLSSVAESINNSLNLPSHSSKLSRISRIKGLLRIVFNIDWFP